MYIYSRRFDKFLSNVGSFSNKKSNVTPIRINNRGKNSSFLLKFNNQMYLTYSPLSNSYLSVSTDFSGVNVFYIEDNKYIYVIYNNLKYFLTVKDNLCYLSSDPEEEEENQRFEFVRTEGICKQTLLKFSNNFRNIITDLTFPIKIKNLSKILRLGHIYNYEDSLDNCILPELYGHSANSVLNYCEPCCSDKEICQDNLGIKMHPLLYGNTILTGFSEQDSYKDTPCYDTTICIFHFTPELLANKYYHLNKEKNNGFLFSQSDKKSYTDSNIKKLSSFEYFCLENVEESCNYSFRNYELVIRESFSLDYLRHVTFFDYNFYIVFKQEIERYYMCSCSSR